MDDTLRVVLIFIAMMLMIRVKVPIGIALIVGALFLGVLSELGFSETMARFWAHTAAWDTALLTGMVISVTLFGQMLKHVENLKQLVHSLDRLVPDRRAQMAMLPAIIGFLPMPGGAMLSAPMVKEVSAGLEVSAERTMVVNHWFRHVWEYMFPLYPGVILLASLLDVPMQVLMRFQFPLTLFAITAGLVFCLRRIGRGASPRRENGSPAAALGGLLVALLPVIAAVGGTILLQWLTGSKRMDLPLLANLAMVMVALVAIFRIRPRPLFHLFRAISPLELLVFVIGVMVFKGILRDSGSIEGVHQTLSRLHGMQHIVVFVLPMIAGALTGSTYAYIAIAFPLLMGLLAPGGEVRFSLVALGFAGGYLGQLVSPVHLCFSLGKSYFRASWAGIYRIIVPPTLLMAALVAIWAAVLYSFGL